MARRKRSKKIIREDADRINFYQIQVTVSDRHLPWRRRLSERQACEVSVSTLAGLLAKTHIG
jgi:hypothetical protein